MKNLCIKQRNLTLILIDVCFKLENVRANKMKVSYLSASLTKDRIKLVVRLNSYQSDATIRARQLSILKSISPHAS